MAYGGLVGKRFLAHGAVYECLEWRGGPCGPGLRMRLVEKAPPDRCLPFDYREVGDEVWVSELVVGRTYRVVRCHHCRAELGAEAVPFVGHVTGFRRHSCVPCASRRDPM